MIWYLRRTWQLRKRIKDLKAESKAWRLNADSWFEAHWESEIKIRQLREEVKRLRTITDNLWTWTKAL